MSDRPFDNFVVPDDVYVSQPEPDKPPIVSIQSTPDYTSNVIRIDACIRLAWVCASGHDHRLRITAWLCDLVKGVQK